MTEALRPAAAAPRDAADPDPRDVAVVGGGPVGLAAAIGLARAGRRVTLFGAGPPRRDGRTVAVMRPGLDLLLGLGLDLSKRPDVAPLRALRIVDDTGSLFRAPPVTFRAEEIGLAAFGLNVEAAALVEALTALARTTPNLALDARRVTGTGLAGARRALALDDGREVAFGLVVATDGRASPTRAGAGIGVRRRVWGQTALTAILDHARPHENVSTEFQTRDGPCTLVPLPGLRSSLVWMMRTDAAERRAALDDAAFAAEIERATHAVLGAVSPAGPRGRASLETVTAERFAAPRLLLAGEAAHAFPPIGAQGLNLGLRDVGDALRCVAASRDDVGGPAVTEGYERARAGDIRLRTAGVDALNASLLAGLGAVDLARGAGLVALGGIGPLRRAAMRAGLAAGRAAHRGRAYGNRS